MSNYVALRRLVEFNPPVPHSTRLTPKAAARLLPMDSVGHFDAPKPGETRPIESLLQGYAYIEPSDVAYAKVTPCFENGKGLIGTDLVEPSFGSSELTVLRPNSMVDQRYLSYVLRSGPFRAPAIASMTGAGGLKRVDEQQMRALRVWTPPIREQRAIADHLDHETTEIDEFISDQIALIKLLKARRRSTVDSHVLASGSIPTPLKYLGRLRSGITLGAKYDQGTQVYPYLRVANVQTDRVDLTDIAMAEVPKHIAEANRLFAGDVLMTEGGDRDKLGRGALWNGEVEAMLHQNHVFAFRPNAGISAAYLVYVLESSAARYYFDVTAKQSTNLASTNSTLVKNFRVPLWAIEKQAEIVASLDAECAALHEAVRDAQKIIELSQERRAALISAAVTGQIDVTPRHRPVAEQLEAEVLQDA